MAVGVGLRPMVAFGRGMRVVGVGVVMEVWIKVVEVAFGVGVVGWTRRKGR